MQTGQKVMLQHDGYAVPKLSTGIVIGVDNKRSRYGFNTEVAWEDREIAHTWVPDTALRPFPP